MTPRHLTSVVLLGLLALPGLARAHYVWIEAEARKGARFYFGEYNEGLREKAGGRLEERAALQAWLQPSGSARQPLQLGKKLDHFAATTTESKGWLTAADLGSEVKDFRELGVVKPMFYARAALGNAAPPDAPTLELDLLPVAGKASSYRVYFAGNPLPGAKVFIYAPNLWMRELVSNERGELEVVTPWPGRYVLDVVHKDPRPGTYRGQAYPAVRHRMTFSFVH
jgi:hypothetical protein